MKSGNQEKITIEKMVEDSQFRNLLSEEIERIRRFRNIGQSSGIKYKRNVCDFLEENHLLNIDSFSREFVLIHYKKSTLPAGVRNYIRGICLSAAIKDLHLKNSVNNQSELLTQ